MGSHEEPALPTRDGRQVLVLLNPTAGSHSRDAALDRLVALLTARGYAASVFTDAGQIVDAAQRARAAGVLRAVVAAGGDGTVALVVNRIPADAPVVLFPLGTENLLARYFGVTRDPDQALNAIERGVVVRLDAGSANGRLFLLMVGVGFDAEVVRRVHSQRTGHIRRWAYFKPILAAMRSYQYPELRLYSETAGGPAPAASPINSRWAFVVNVPRYAGGLRFAPDADATDGRLDVCTFLNGSWWNGLKYYVGVRAGWHRAWSDCVTWQATKLRIEADVEVPYQTDGDAGGLLPVDIEVLPGRVTLLVPGET